MSENLERQREHFNSIAHAYLQGKMNPNFLKLQSLIWEPVLNTLNETVNKKISVLEPMCGYLEGYKVLQKLNVEFDYSGFDYSEEIVRSLSERSPEIDVFHGDVTTYSTKSKFDIIILIGGLHHIPEHAGMVVKNLSEFLKEGGLFINFEPTHGNYINKAIRNKIYNENNIFDEMTERAFSVKELESFFLSAGLDVEFIQYPGLLSYVLYYNQYAFPNLNIGDERFVKRIYSFDRLFINNFIGRVFSFSTLSVWRKNS